MVAPAIVGKSMKNKNLLRNIMQRRWALSLTLVFGFSLVGSLPAANDANVQAATNQQAGATSRALSLPLYFEENRGQTDASVRFVNRTGRTTTFLRDNDLVMRLQVSSEEHRGFAVVQMQFLDSSDSVALEGSLFQAAKYLAITDFEDGLE